MLTIGATKYYQAVVVRRKHVKIHSTEALYFLRNNGVVISVDFVPLNTKVLLPEDSWWKGAVNVRSFCDEALNRTIGPFHARFEKDGPMNEDGDKWQE